MFLTIIDTPCIKSISQFKKKKKIKSQNKNSLISLMCPVVSSSVMIDLKIYKNLKIAIIDWHALKSSSQPSKYAKYKLSNHDDSIQFINFVEI